MPTYDYKCNECGTRFEVFHGMNESPDVHCPECNAVASKQISAGAGIVFKGSGFYVTDYKNNGSKKESTKTATAEKKQESVGCGANCACANE
ncbi:MAG: zinc ribbon domain-containing protein [Candidatus Hydrogenedentota bacterium]|nr:MAG: zinc ribbon domain-containing protein [Candidatus Hydrogenedentota bacterium]